MKVEERDIFELDQNENAYLKANSDCCLFDKNLLVNSEDFQELERTFKIELNFANEQQYLLSR